MRQVLPGAESLGFWESLQVLRQTAGSGRGAARLAGVDEKSIRRWIARQATPKPATRERVERAAREARTPQPVAQDRFSLRIERYEPRRRNRQREGNVPASKLDLAPGTLDRVRSTFVATGDSDRALLVFVKGVGNEFYSGNLIPRELRDDRPELFEEFEDDQTLPDEYPISIA